VNSSYKPSFRRKFVKNLFDSIFSLFVWFTITILSYTVIAFILAVCRPTVCVLYCLYGVINDDDDNTVLLYSLNPKFCKENVKNCMLISHFA